MEYLLCKSPIFDEITFSRCNSTRYEKVCQLPQSCHNEARDCLCDANSGDLYSPGDLMRGFSVLGSVADEESEG